ncbi:unnamed protein product [Phytomonas sp. EM1]|nr:unnamed protein product [Phytomonas sp. EM1]|eukprot:CCW63382.1 unnamed protein product [Phytomonas sp. isolate EM1]
MKFFCCQPDSHNGFGALTNGILSYFTVDYQHIPHTLKGLKILQATKSDTSGESHLQNHNSPNSNYPGMDDKAKVRVQKSITLPGVFHSQNSCFSMANQSIFGIDLACVGSSNGVLALVVLGDKSLVYAPERDPQTVRESFQQLMRRSQQDAQQRHLMHPMPSDAPDAAADGVAFVGDRPSLFATRAPHANTASSSSPLPLFESDLLPHDTVLDAPSTITCMRNQPLVFVGYMSGRIEWYQVNISSNKRRQYGEIGDEAHYEVVLSNHYPKHINQVDQSSHVSRIYYHGEGDGVRMFVVARCCLPESGPLITSDYFPANAHLVVGSTRTIAVFSTHQLECPAFRLSHVGCSLLYCHPCLPIIGALGYSWNITPAHLRGGPPQAVGVVEKPCDGPSPASPAVRGSTPGEDPHPQVLFDSPNGLNGGCLLRIFEIAELTSSVTGSPAQSPETRPIGASNGRMGEVGDAVDSAAMPHGCAANKETFALRLVQERLYPISSKQYGAYFCFSWKFSLDLELALCNVVEGVVYVVRLHRQYLPQQRELSEKKVLRHLGGDRAISDANPTKDYLVPSLKYAFTSEHRVRLPLHSLLNVEYVSAATIPLIAMTSHAAASSSGQVKQGLVRTTGHGKEAGGKVAGSPIMLQTAVSGNSKHRSQRAAANQTDPRDGVRYTRGGLGYANAAQRFAALFHSQDNCASEACSGGGHIPREDGDSEIDSNQTDPLFLTRMTMDSISYLYAIRACGWGGNVPPISPLSRSSDTSAFPLNFPIGVNSCGIRRSATIMSPKETKLTQNLLGHRSANAVLAAKGARGNAGDAKKTSQTYALQPDRLQRNGAAKSAERPPNRYDSRMNAYTEGVSRAKDTSPLLQIGVGSISNLVGLNQAGEIMSIPIECEAIATWHEEGSVFTGLGTTVYSVDIISLQDIDREIAKRARAGFGLSAQENAVVLRQILEVMKRPAVYRGALVPPSTQALAANPDDNPMLQHTKDIEKLFSYVALLERAGVVLATGDVPSVLSLLEMEEELSGVAEDGAPQATRSVDFERVDPRKRLLLEVLDWLPSASCLPSPSLKSDGVTAPRVFHSQEELEREVAVQVLHGRFETGAALLELSYHNASFSSSMRYSSMVSLLRYPAQTVGLIRGSNLTARHTFLKSLSPWLLAVFLHLCADSKDNKESHLYRARIYVDTRLSLWDRVAMASLLEPDYPRLIQVLQRYMLPTCSLVQSLMLEHGISPRSFSKMQQIVDCTGDFQLGACLYARVGVRLVLPKRFVGGGERGGLREEAGVRGVPYEGGLACCPSMHTGSLDLVSFHPASTTPPSTASASPSVAFSRDHGRPLPASVFIPPSQVYSSVLPPPPEVVGGLSSTFRSQPLTSSTPLLQAGALEDPTPARGEGKNTEEAYETETDDGEGNNWLWWTEAYRAFLDNEQNFVERTMFDVACQRLHEEYLASLSLSRTGGSSWRTKSGGDGTGLNAGSSLSNTVSVNGIPAPALPTLPHSPSLSLSAALPLFPGAVHSATLQHVRFLTKILNATPVADPPDGTVSCSPPYPSKRIRDGSDNRRGEQRLVLPPQLQTLALSMSNQPLRCAICLRPVSLHQQDAEQSLAWCTACSHGGHAHHLREWFSAHRVCAVEGCCCHCD